MFDPPEQRRDALRTDLYQLTMAAAMHRAGFDHEASFELFTRRLTGDRGFWLACGLELALDYLEGLRFHGEDLDYLRTVPGLGEQTDFLERLRELRFTGGVWAIPEGTPTFPWEPLLRLTGPALEVQLVETYLLSLINFQTLIATKAARVREACRGKSFVDFGTRRAHGPEAGELVARASYIAGAAGTSNVEAGRRLGIPVIGTFAHAWVMSFADEAEAFRRYAEAFPKHTTLLIDTYDTVAAARRIAAEGLVCQAVRLDSGDLLELSLEVRRVFDQGGREEIQIVASNDLNELKIEELERRGCAIDLYGVGTELATSKDLPALGGVYKIVETRHGDEVRYPMKLSQDKRSWPGRKQVFRRGAPGGPLESDLIALADEPAPPGSEPLLEPVLRAGRRLRPAPPLEALRERCTAELGRLPAGVRRLTQPQSFPVDRSDALVALADRIQAEVEARERSRL
ncbi:MAG: nicotinate phosphoribosyltransferase [Planctomycetota bacterium]